MECIIQLWSAEDDSTTTICIYVYVLFVECFKQSVLILFFIVMLNKIEVKNFALKFFLSEKNVYMLKFFSF